MNKKVGDWVKLKRSFVLAGGMSSNIKVLETYRTPSGKLRAVLVPEPRVVLVTKLDDYKPNVTYESYKKRELKNSSRYRGIDHRAPGKVLKIEGESATVQFYLPRYVEDYQLE